MPSNALPPGRRLRRRAEFQRVFETGRRAHGRYVTIIAATGASHARLGIVASKKLGGAVLRNRAKRLIRETFRTLDEAAPARVDLVVVPKVTLFDASLSRLREDFRVVLGRCLCGVK